MHRTSGQDFARTVCRLSVNGRVNRLLEADSARFTSDKLLILLEMVLEVQKNAVHGVFSLTRTLRRGNKNLISRPEQRISGRTFFSFNAWRTSIMASEKEPLIVASKVKAYIKSKNMMTSSEALGELNEKIYALLDDAVARTQANKRSTVKPQDL